MLRLILLTLAIELVSSESQCETENCSRDETQLLQVSRHRTDKDFVDFAKNRFPGLKSNGKSWTFELPSWTLDVPFFASEHAELAWRRLPMPFWEEKDVVKTDSEQKFQGKGYIVQFSLDHNVILPSSHAVNERCNEGRWPGNQASLQMQAQHLPEGHKPNSKVLVAARPAGSLWAHWIDNTFLKFGWLYPLMKPDLENWKVYDTHDGESQKGVLQVIDLLKLQDENEQSLDLPGTDKSTGTLLTVCDLPSIHPDIIRGAREAVLDAAGVPDQSVEELKKQSQCKVVYVQRNGASTANGRSMPNEDEVYNKVQEHVAAAGPKLGFSSEVVRFSFDSRSLKENVGLLSQGCVFLGAHGAALYHTIWGARNATLIELFPESAVGGQGFAGSLSYNVFWAISKGLGHRYGFGLYNSSQADLTEIKKLLDMAM